ncbi:MAG: hypothetical protein JRJ60_20400, partial [Deltaproteobacteria bacterium]|nr:hypothetical protein [Deltaproteobacteria bacterium]
MNPAIVVVAYNREGSLKRLLGSLIKARYADRADLIVSMDKSDNAAVYETAEAFDWPHGEKRLIRNTERLGLRRHIMACGDLTDLYGSVIILEDDTFAAPDFYRFASAALSRYRSDDRVAGIALYAMRYNETARQGFTPFIDHADVFFMQLPCSWGQCWTKAQWGGFKGWINEKGAKRSFADFDLPDNIRRWPETSWKKAFAAYMVEKDLYFVYPRASLTTNFEEAGVHHQRDYGKLQVPLQWGRDDFKFKSPDESLALYDAYHEMIPSKLSRLAADLSVYDFEVDLYGQKDIGKVKKEYILTSKKARKAIKTFGKKLKPIELNMACDIAGSDIVLAKTSDCLNDYDRFA